jgi:hypothetical protein
MNAPQLSQQGFPVARPRAVLGENLQRSENVGLKNESAFRPATLDQHIGGNPVAAGERFEVKLIVRSCGHAQKALSRLASKGSLAVMEMFVK